MAEIAPFTIEIPEATLDDLRQRLARTRFADEVDGAGWTYGTPVHYLKPLVEHWRTRYDWRSHEKALNALPQFRTEIDGLGIHFVHARGHGANPVPIVLTHGWPDSFWRFSKLIPLLVEERDGVSFDVVAPSLPGYAFSDRPKDAGALFRIGDLWTTLMTERLGYHRFAAHGGDWGSTITEQIVRSHGDSLLGVHLTDVPFGHTFDKPADLSFAEERFFARNEIWMKTEAAYAMQQGTKPQTLAAGVSDSPAGLAAWIVEKFRTWSDCGGDVETRFSKDDLLTNITLYWATETIGSSFRLYHDRMNAGVLTYAKEAIRDRIGPPAVPAALASFPKDLNPPPREWAERFFAIERFTEMPRGGHFAAFEEPELLASDLRAFFGPLARR